MKARKRKAGRKIARSFLFCCDQVDLNIDEHTVITFLSLFPSLTEAKTEVKPRANFIKLYALKHNRGSRHRARDKAFSIDIFKGMPY